MGPNHYTLMDLFSQLGLASDVHSMDLFMTQHSLRGASLRLEEARFWSPFQRSFLQEQWLADSDWVVVIDRLNVALH